MEFAVQKSQCELGPTHFQVVAVVASATWLSCPSSNSTDSLGERAVLEDVGK